MFSVKTQYFLTGEELSQNELFELLDRAEEFRLSPSSEILKDKHIALIFEKPSLRTRVSFTVGIQQMGGQVVELQGSQKKSEDPEDTIRVLQGMVQGVMLRTFEHSILEKMVSKATIPVINGLSDLHHPCQAIADLLTLKQNFKKLKGLKLAYVGDGNNVLHSLLLLLPFAGVDVHFACPRGYEPNPKILETAKKRVAAAGARIIQFTNPQDAVKDVHAIYTDVWTSMGFEEENEKRLKAFKGYQLNIQMLNLAKPNAIALHCLPMVKGQEITEEVAEHPRSVLFQQAENRLHAQKALLEGIYAGLAKSQRMTQKLKEYHEFNAAH